MWLTSVDRSSIAESIGTEWACIQYPNAESCQPLLLTFFSSSSSSSFFLFLLTTMIITGAETMRKLTLRVCPGIIAEAEEMFK